MSLKTAYDYTDELKSLLIKENLVVDLSMKFKEILDNAKRVKFCENLLQQYNLIPDYEKYIVDKSKGYADEYRNEGNLYYGVKKYVAALLCYNKSLSFSLPGSESLGMAYANRSATYFEMEMYENCLNNIRLARNNGYPSKNLWKLSIREEKCMSMMSISNVPSKYMSSAVGKEFFKLSYPANKTMPFVVDCLELQQDDVFGRFITTKIPLHAGDIIAIEEPFSKVLLAKSCYKYCANCFDDNFQDLIPCLECTGAMYCSEKCLEEGFKKFHQYECPIVDSINKLFTKVMTAAERTFFEALDICNGSIDELEEAIERNKGSSTTVFDYDFGNPDDPMKRMNLLMAIDALNTNEEERSHADFFQRAGVVAIMFNLFKTQSPVKDLLVTEKNMDFFRRFLFKQSQISASNYHGIFGGVSSRSEGAEENEQSGCGSFPFSSLINHSCAPNLVRLSHKTVIYVVVNRSVKAGGQLFDNYGFHHCLESLSERQFPLKDQYNFKCSCEACTLNYPLFHDLKKTSYQFQRFMSDDVEMLQKLTVERAKSKYKPYCELIDELEDQYPCFEISALQECVLRCLDIFALSEFNIKFM
ncbi:unnamed protein product [Diamesa serratosioi]